MGEEGEEEEEEVGEFMVPHFYGGNEFKKFKKQLKIADKINHKAGNSRNKNNNMKGKRT